MTAPVVTDRTVCRECGASVHTVWCTDGLWRFFDPVPVAGRGWWWSRRRAGMVAPGVVSASSVEAYRVHVCPEENLPVGQLELFPAEVVARPTRRPAPVRRVRQVTA